jgi:hypothetical protein
MSMRLAVLGFVLVLLAARPADARRGVVVVNFGDDIELIRTLEHAVDTSPVYGASHSLDKLGYKYTRFGLFWVDLWRWDGEFIAYDGIDGFGGGGYYVVLTDEELEALGGASVPWSYRLPPGFLLILAGLELFIVTRRKRSARFAMIAGIVFVLLAVILLVLGLGPAVMIPGFLGLYHLAAAFLSPAVPDDNDVATETTETAATPRPRPIERVPVPRVETDPFRAPPQQAPIHIVRASQPVVAPLAVDPDAEAPKLLR